MQDNHVYHLTARCHDKSFLFGFARWRDEYRRRLRMALHRSGVWLLGECVTSNHVHLLEIGDLRREPQWTESIAVGDREFVMGVAERVRGRTKLEICESPGGIWVVRDGAREAEQVAGTGESDPYDEATLTS